MTMKRNRRKFCPLDGGHCPTRKGGTVYSHGTMASVRGTPILNEGGRHVGEQRGEEAVEEDLDCRFWSNEEKESKLILGLSRVYSGVREPDYDDGY